MQVPIIAQKVQLCHWRSTWLLLVSLLMIGCGAESDEIRPDTVFPREGLTGYSNVGGDSETTGTTEGGGQLSPSGMGFTLGENSYQISPEQVNLVDNQASVILNGVFLDGSNITRALTLTFLTFGVNFPAEFGLSTDPQEIGPDRAILGYSETTSSETPSVATAVANGLLRVETYTNNKVAGSFAFDANLPNDEVRLVRSGTFSIDR